MSSKFGQDGVNTLKTGGKCEVYQVKMYIYYMKMLAHIHHLKSEHMSSTPDDGMHLPSQGQIF